MDEANELNDLYQQALHAKRNDPCWCGSDLKYKFCHRDRHRTPQPSLEEIKSQYERIFERKVCMHADAGKGLCSNIIQAHTLQRSEMSKIARDGKVYGITGNYIARMKSQGQIEFGLIGLRNASTFYGFCATHDSPTFAALETKPFIGTSEQCFLLAYRVICRELYMKQGQLMAMKFMHELDRGRPLEDQIALQYRLSAFKTGVEIGLAQVSNLKAAYDTALRRHDFDKSRHYVVLFDRPPDLVAAGGMLPEYDFAGKALQNLGENLEKPLDHITFSLVPTYKGGAAVFSWLGSSPAGEAFMRSLDAIANADVSSALVRFALEWFENIFAAPPWWDGLDETIQMKLRQRMESGIGFENEPTPDNLLDDGLRPVTWNVVDRRTNLVI